MDLKVVEPKVREYTWMKEAAARMEVIREAARVRHFKESESRNKCYNAGTIKNYSHVGS